MFNKLAKIQNVNKGYYITENQLFYQSGESIYQYDFVGDKEIYFATVKNNYQRIIKVEDLIVGISSLGYTCFNTDFQTIKMISVENGLGDYNLFNGNLIIVTTDYDYTNFLPKQGIQDIFSDKILWESDLGETIHIKSNVAFAVSFNEICKREITNGEVKWLFKTNTGKSIPKLINVYENVLVVGLNEDILLGINTETGELLWKIEECNNRNYVLDEREGKLKGITAIGYFEVDIATGKYNRTLFMPIEKLDDPEVFDSQRDNFVLVGDHIITTDWRRGIIAAFNTKTLKYDWTHHEKGVSFPGGSPMKYYEPYLFVTDNKNTLHIFKKEDSKA